MVKLTLSRFRELFAELGVLASPEMVSEFYHRVMQEFGERKPEPTNKFIAAYCEAFKRRYETNPPIIGQSAGLAKNIVKSLGLDRACRLVETYVAMNDSYFQTKGHDLSTFYANISKVVVHHETGKSVTRSEANNLERRQTNINAFAKLLAEAGSGEGE
jgi:hypothetical protein